jgi:hypothetical protein
MTMPSVPRDPSNAQHDCARRIKKGNRIVVLPPAGHGQVWVGGTKRG